jgi:hypothetical protein
VKVGPRIDEKLFKVEVHPLRPMSTIRMCAVSLDFVSLQVDLVKRENERLHRQIEILSNKFKTATASSDVLVREGWLDKRSERLHQANVRPLNHHFPSNP